MEKKDGSWDNLSYKASLNLLTETDKYIENCRTISVVSTLDTQIQNRTLTNTI